MEKKKEEALDQFLDQEQEEKQSNNEKKKVLDEREGLIERVDKVFVTSDGRQLIRERY